MCVCVVFVCVSACGGFEPHQVRGGKAEPKLVGRQAAAALAGLWQLCSQERKGGMSVVGPDDERGGWCPAELTYALRSTLNECAIIACPTNQCWDCTQIGPDEGG